MCANVTKRTITPSLQKRKERGRVPSGAYADPAREACQFEGLQIQRIGNDKLYYRLGTSTDSTFKNTQAKKKQQPHGQIFSTQNRPAIIPKPMPVPAKYGTTRWVKIKQPTMVGLPAKNEPNHKANGQHELQFLQHQHTLFPYKKAPYNPGSELKARISTHPVSHNEAQPLTATYIRHTNRPADTQYTKQKRGQKYVLSPKKNAIAQLSSLPMSGTGNARKLNNLISVGHNITHVWNYNLMDLGIDANTPFPRRSSHELYPIS